MYCRQCGAQIEAEASFCDQCGQPVQEPEALRAVPTPIEPVAPQKKKTSAPSAQTSSYASRKSAPSGSQTLIRAHWYTLIEGLQASPLAFYESVEQAIHTRQIADIRLSQVDWREGGLFSAKRVYLRVQRHEHIFDICGAPFGNGFFVSWWRGEPMGCLFWFVDAFPLIGGFFKFLLRPPTYYRIDTGLMFQSAIHGAVLEVVDGLTQAKGLRALTELERKPILREFMGGG